jgi:ubiquitin related modifier 1
MELLFDNQRRCDVQLPVSYALDDLLETGFPSAPSEGERPADLRFLIHWLRHCLLSDFNRPDLFMQGQTVCVRSGCVFLVLMREASVDQGSWSW